MKAEILAVGTELLLGDILNTNAQFLAQELAALGIEVYYQTVVGAFTNLFCMRRPHHHHRRPWAYGGRSDKGNGGEIFRGESRA